MAFHSFEDLDIWKRSCRLAVQVYEHLQNCREFGLKDQMTRAAVSIASNIAEGAERNRTPDFIRFQSIAKGSAMLHALVESLRPKTENYNLKTIFALK